MGLIEKVEEGLKEVVEDVKEFFTGEGDAVEKAAESAAGDVEAEAGNVVKAVEVESTQAAATGAAAESYPVPTGAPVTNEQSPAA